MEVDGLCNTLHGGFPHAGGVSMPEDGHEGSDSLILVPEVDQLRSRQQLGHQAPQSLQWPRPVRD